MIEKMKDDGGRTIRSGGRTLLKKIYNMGPAVISQQYILIDLSEDAENGIKDGFKRGGHDRMEAPPPIRILLRHTK